MDEQREERDELAALDRDADDERLEQDDARRYWTSGSWFDHVTAERPNE